MGRDEYPTTLEAAHKLLIRTAEENKRRGNRRYGVNLRNRGAYGGTNISFAQDCGGLQLENMSGLSCCSHILNHVLLKETLAYH